MKKKVAKPLPDYVPPPCVIVLSDTGLVPTNRWWDKVQRPLRHLREQFLGITDQSAGKRQVSDPTAQRKLLPPSSSGVAISYLSAGDPSAKPVILIHGSPGHASEWEPYLKEVPNGQYRIAVDRPGYGESLPATPMPSLSAQAAAIAPLLRPDSIVVGYSFGGLVALHLALDFADKVAGLVLIGCPIDPADEHVHPLQRLAATEFMSNLLPQNLNTSNFELMSLGSELSELANRLDGIHANVSIFQGQQDTLVTFKNLKLLADKLVGSAPRQVIFPDGDHYLPWTRQEAVEQGIAYTIKDCS